MSNKCYVKINCNIFDSEDLYLITSPVFVADRARDPSLWIGGENVAFQMWAATNKKHCNNNVAAFSRSLKKTF